ncbi:HEPN domain-containing protein [Deferrisoma palaeochoriense]
MHDPNREARRWILQAMDDLRFVEWIRREGVFFDKACFLSQQAGEKALKACLYGLGRRRVFGHSLMELLEDLVQADPAFEALRAAGARLDRYYISTRYPNGLPGGCPFQAYNADDLTQAEADARNVVETAASFLRARGILEDSGGGKCRES